jgi:hypothetical protein
MNSEKLAYHLYESGMLSKQAMSQVMHVRQRLYKKAMEKQAAGVISWILGKGRAAGDVLSRLGRSVAETPRPIGSRVPLHQPGAVEEVITKRLDPQGNIVDVLEQRQIEGLPIKEMPAPPVTWMDAAANLAKLTALGTGLGAAQAGVTGAIQSIRDWREENALRRDIAGSYQQMFAEEPMLGSMDPDKVQKNFDILARYAPSLATNPIVASNWVKQTAGRGGFLDPDAIKRLAEAERAAGGEPARKDLFDEFQAGLSLARMAMGD